MQTTICNKNVNDSNEFCKLARVMKNDLDYLTKRDVILRFYIKFNSTTNSTEKYFEGYTYILLWPNNICHVLIYISIFLFAYQTTETGMIVS